MKNITSIVIGGSAGSFSVVSEILNNLPSDFQVPIIICMHRLRNVSEGFVEALQLKSSIQVREPFDKEKLKKNTVYLAPANYHMYVELNKEFSLSTEELFNYSRPSIDLTFNSAAYTFKKSLMGIILSGANKDGAYGLKKVKDFGGITVIQDRKESMVATMPKAAEKLTQIDYELTTKEIINLLLSLHELKTSSIKSVSQ